MPDRNRWATKVEAHAAVAAPRGTDQVRAAVEAAADLVNDGMAKAKRMLPAAGLIPVGSIRVVLDTEPYHSGESVPIRVDAVGWLLALTTPNPFPHFHLFRRSPHHAR